MRDIRFLNSNAIKIIAAVLMVIDHIGYFFLPQYAVLRNIGRISFPLFAYMVAEGCHYTRNKVKHLSLLVGASVVCQVVYYLFDGSLDMCIFVTFSLSSLLIYAMQAAKKACFDKACPLTVKLFSVFLFTGLVGMVYGVNQCLHIEYGFWGCMLPVFVSLFDFKDIPMPKWIGYLDNHYVRLLCFAAGIVMLTRASAFGMRQLYGLFAVVILLFYNGKKGKLPLKYFFYLFYPLHLAAFEGIQYLIRYIL